MTMINKKHVQNYTYEHVFLKPKQKSMFKKPLMHILTQKKQKNNNF